MMCVPIRGVEEVHDSEYYEKTAWISEHSHTPTIDFSFLIPMTLFLVLSFMSYYL